MITQANRWKSLKAHVVSNWPYILAGIILGYLIVGTLLSKGVNSTDRIAFLILAAILFLFYWRSRANRLAQVRAGKQQALGAELRFVSLLEAFGIMATVVGLMSPRSAIESQPGIIESAVRQLLPVVRSIKRDTEALREGQRNIEHAVGAGAPSLIRQHIPGIWGEEGCDVTYRFTLRDRSLSVRSEKNAKGMPPFASEYSVIADTNSLSPAGERQSFLEAAETEGYWPGFSVRFQYRTDGSTESLVWEHRKAFVVPLKLVRCDR